MYKSINKEMKMIQVAFGFKEECKCAPAGYPEISCQMIFNANMDFTRQASFIARGHQTETPTSATYDSVVSRDNVCSSLLLEVLNDVDVFSADI